MEVAMPSGAGSVEALRHEIAALSAQVDQLRRGRDMDRDTLDALMTELGRRGPGFLVDTVFDSWTAWVDEWLVQRISRSAEQYRWCHRYADHPEVADRLEALWYTWESQWPDPLSRTTWLRDELDHHWAIVGGEDGPLRECDAGEHVHRLPG